MTESVFNVIQNRLIKFVLFMTVQKRDIGRKKDSLRK